MTEQNSPPLLASQGIRGILDKAREDRAQRDAAAPQRRLAERIDHALQDIFPHIRHDEEFQAAARDYIAAMQTATEDRLSLPCLVGSLQFALDQAPNRSVKEPGEDESFDRLCALYPAYKTMAAEADRDYASLGVRLNMRHPKAQQHGDHWRNRVKEIRGAAEIGG